jgi:hypothetical protein
VSRSKTGMQAEDLVKLSQKVIGKGYEFLITGQRHEAISFNSENRDDAEDA